MDFNKIEQHNINISKLHTFKNINEVKKEAVTIKPAENLTETVAISESAQISRMDLPKILSSSGVFRISDDLILKAMENAVKGATSAIFMLLKRLHSEFAGINDEETLYLFELLLKLETQFTYEHSCRVTRIAELLAKELEEEPELNREVRDGAKFKEMGLGAIGYAIGSDEEQAEVEKLLGEYLKSFRESGELHDIGKIKIPLEIVNKPQQLTNEEFEIMKLHPIIGEELLRPIKSLAHILPVVRHHHERWDGKGYPDKISGTDIPLATRIISIADSFDAMISDRPYRKALTRSMAKNELLRNAGTQFDPAIVSTFIKLIEQNIV